MTGLVPFLTFQPGKGQDAARALQRYLALFDDSELVFEQRHPDGSPGAGSIMLAELRIGSSRLRFSDSYVDHDWDFSPATSLWFDCASDEQQQRLFDGLAANGRVHMPLDDYGFGPFAWVDDQFGVSWQLGRSGLD